MENTTTRISDLPENITMYNSDPRNMGNATGQGAAISTGPINENMGYNPMNIHPNPYGNSSPNPTNIPNPQQTSFNSKSKNISFNMNPDYNEVPPNYIQPPPQSQYLTEEQINNMKHQRLPSRDIVHDTSHYNHDEQIQPNYIPKANVSSNYVLEQEMTTEKNMREYEEKKRRESKLDMMINEFQTPIFIAVLFFLFQLPIINAMIFKRFSFLSIINDDGNFNMYGLLFKSVLFGGLYYSLLKTTNYISSL